MRTRLLHSVPFFLTLGLLLPVAGFRHLWQDEAETAERSRSIAETGLPRFVDSQGRVSLSSGGQELEEGSLHRYTPWAQFYLGAGGLLAGKPLGLSEDAALRTPFIVSHALTSSLVSFGLTAFAGLPAAASAGIGTLLGVQTVRVLHNRTARYHGALDLLTVLGMLGLGMIRRGDGRGRALVAGAMFLLPHFHTIGGGLASSLLGFAALLSSWLDDPAAGARGAIKKNGYAFAAAAASLAALLVLTRPWAQQPWNNAVGAQAGFRSFSVFEAAYALLFAAGAAAWLIRAGARRSAAALLCLAAYALLFMRLGDLHPYSQARYYLFLPLFFLFWPIALPWPKEAPFPRKAWCYALFAALLLPEFLGAFPPGQGLAVVAADWRMKGAGEVQPLRRAFDMIRESGRGGGVIVDYVPQFANWYLRGSPVALMPDRAVMTRLNAGNPLWAAPPAEPEWHLSFPTKYNGTWVCAPRCDYRAEGLTPASERYALVSGALNRTFEMCVVGRWGADAWNNAPFSGYQRAALRPEGLMEDVLVLAVRCAP